MFYMLLALLGIGLILDVIGLYLAINYATKENLKISKFYYKIMEIGEVTTKVALGLIAFVVGLKIILRF